MGNDTQEVYIHIDCKVIPAEDAPRPELKFLNFVRIQKSTPGVIVDRLYRRLSTPVEDLYTFYLSTKPQILAAPPDSQEAKEYLEFGLWIIELRTSALVDRLYGKIEGRAHRLFRKINTYEDFLAAERFLRWWDSCIINPIWLDPPEGVRWM